MTIAAGQFRDLIKRTLIAADMHSKNAVELLMGTAAMESHLGTYIKQIHGPALGVFQMEPETERDIWKNYLKYRPKYIDAIVRVSNVPMPDAWALETNLAYQIIMARIHYLRVPHPLPYYTDLQAMAEYWNEFYNCNPAKGHPPQFIISYKTYGNPDMRRLA